ncbi:MAG: hypothetical protein K2I13_04800 [Alistipes sp.]|nr:hypothetical protein [Alistipes sp.]
MLYHILMSHLIITFIGITKDERVIVERASNNLRPLEFRTVEIEPLTALYREKGMAALEEELLWLFFQGIWQQQHDGRFARAIERYKQTESVDSHSEYLHCHGDEAYRRERMKHIAENYLQKIAAE